jgi:choline-sulfatase
MRILYLDLDTLRPDHLGCYGYHRNTSPNIDSIAAQGIRFDNYYVTDAPCLPSRAALFNGRFGIHTGVVGHGGTAADLRIEGEPRGFRNSKDYAPWMVKMREAGFHTVSVSPFAERHGAWWFYHGFSEMLNPGKGGQERADEVAPLALDWIKRKGETDNWFLQVNFWDPHTPYRAPPSYGNPFENDPPPDWLTEEIRARHYEGYGPNSAHEPRGYSSEETPESRQYPDVPREIASMADWKRWIDGYDTGIRYMDDYIGQLLESLDRLGVLEETAVIISSDHGENQGELNVYGDHHTADHITSRVPLIVRWPGMASGTVEKGLLYNLDLPPTVMELVGGSSAPTWDGSSFAPAIRGESFAGRDSLVVSQCAWSCQRSVRWDDWIMIRTYHDGLKDFPEVMLFNVADDPHELSDLASSLPDLVDHGLAILEGWTSEMMRSSNFAEDPLWRVIREGGPYHTRGQLDEYCDRLRNTGRVHHADALEARHQRRR